MLFTQTHKVTNDQPKMPIRTKVHTTLYFWTCALCMMLAVYFQDSGPLKRAELLLYDLWLPETSEIIDPFIHIVDIDEKSLREIGRWPWPRTELAHLLDKVQQNQPIAVGLDILMPESGHPTGDLQLNHQIQSANVFTATTFTLVQGESREDWPRAESQITVTNTLAPAHIAHITPIHDIDGAIRRIPPVICAQDKKCFPALSVSLLEKVTGSKYFFNLKKNAFCIGELCQPLSTENLLLIPFQPGKNFAYTSAVDILKGQSSITPGSLVLIGSSATGLGDIVSTPVVKRMPGVEVHASIISAWLDNYSLQELPHKKTHSILLAFCLSGLFFICFINHKAILFFAITFIFTPSIVQFLIWHSQYWLNPVPVIVMTLGASIFIVIRQLLYTYNDRRALEDAFSSYVPPFVIDQLKKSGQQLEELDAQRSKITVLFADIKGFTSLSEQLEPEQLVLLTNILFTGLTERIYEYQGTLDKYMGDAVMAFWGAPLPTAKHAELAFKCALSMQEHMEHLNSHFISRGLPEVSLCIGMESGTAVVGNLGAKQRRAYTALGAIVNTAARIQSAASHHSKPILLGPGTVDQLPPDCKTIAYKEQKLKGINDCILLSTPSSSSCNDEKGVPSAFGGN